MNPQDAYSTLQKRLNDTASFIGEPFMHAAVASLQTTLGADFVFISQTVHGVPGSVRMIAARRNGQAVDGWTFQLCGTPCDLIYTEQLEEGWASMKIGRSVAISDRVCELFDATRGTRFQSFVGVPLFDGGRRMVGHLALFFDRSSPDRGALTVVVELVELFAQKIQAELNRMNADRERDGLLAELRRLVEQLEHESITCPLTGLFNRRYFQHRMAQLQASKGAASGGGLLLIDIDHFKQINDTHGHDVGDAVLKYVAGTLKRVTRKDGEEVFRLGGDELAVLVAGDIGHDALRRLGTRLAAAISRDWQSMGGALHPPTLSIGGTCCSVDDGCWEETYVRADRALYASKRNGRNQTTVTDERLPEPAL